MLPRLVTVTILGLGALEVRQPTHGDFDPALLIRLAQIGEGDEEPRAALIAETAAAFARLDAPLQPLSYEAARDAADALCEAIGLTAERRGEIHALLGVRGECRDNILGEDGAVLRARDESDGPRPECSFRCPAGRCLAGRGMVSVEVERLVRDWRLCRAYGCLPRAGGLEEQDAAVIFWFDEMDELARVLAANCAPVLQPQETT